MTIFAGIVAIVLLAAAIWLSGIFTRKGEAEFARAFRELLLAKSNGQISEEEFQSKQAALQESLIGQSIASGKPARNMKLALALAAVASALLAYALLGGQAKNEVSPAMAMVASGIGEQLSGKRPAGSPGLAEPGAPATKAGDLNSLVDGLAQKMEKDPANGDGWLLLARTYGELHRYADADKAYERAAALLSPDAQALADWVDAHVMANERKWDDKGRDLIKRAVAADGKNPKVLSLAGSEAFDRAKYKQAIEFWNKLIAATPEDSMDRKLAEANIAEAKAMLQGKKPAPAGAAAANISGTVSLSKALWGKVAPGDTVFVVAKAVNDGGPPVAVARYKVADLPLAFKLDDSAGIVPGRVISAFDEVQLSARISKSGDAAIQKGDIVSAPLKARLGADGLKLELVSVR